MNNYLKASRLVTRLQHDLNPNDAREQAVLENAVRKRDIAEAKYNEFQS